MGPHVTPERPESASTGDDHQTVGKRPRHEPPATPPQGPGMAGGGAAGVAEDAEVGPAQRTSARPTTTSTPGGTLGAPTERELKADPEAASEKG
jgi:hypothetical protein